MKHEIQKRAEQLGLVGLDSEALNRLLELTMEAEANVARLPGRRPEDEPAHVFFVPQRAL
jgi:hypothetical protein